jgi:hypothetical protein
MGFGEWTGLFLAPIFVMESVEGTMRGSGCERTVGGL